MEDEILRLVNDFWKFDENQQPISNWNDKQDLLNEISKLYNKISKRDGVQHYCGLQGFNSMLGDSCPACNKRAKKRF